MALSTRRRMPDPDGFPTVQLFLIAIVRVAEPIALTSIFPYAWQLVKNFGVGDGKNASFYSGLLISAFSLAEACSSMFWGSLSDKIGRKPVLLCGCTGTIFSLLIVGLAPNIWIALAGRVLGGILNGNVAVIQTMVSELVTKPEYEPRAYSIMPFVWSIGTIIGPAIGGMFSEPAHSFPNIFSTDGIFGYYPYLLPNLICATLLLVSILTGYFLLEETRPRIHLRDTLPSPTYISDRTPLIATGDARNPPIVGLRNRVYGSFDSNEESSSEDTPPKCESVKPFTKRVVGLIIALGIFSYHSMTYDHLLPIFLEDEPASKTLALTASVGSAQSSGGLGLRVEQVGLIMSVDGALALFIQAFIFPFVAAHVEIGRLVFIVTIFHPFSFLAIPYLTELPARWLFTGIYSCLFLRNILSIIAYPALLILIKKATPCSTVLGKVNGLAASVGAASRTIAPPLSGYLYSIGLHTKFMALAWYASAFVAVIGAIQILTIRGPREYSVEEPWKDAEALILVNPSVNSLDDEDGNHGIGLEFQSDLREEYSQ